MRVFYVRPSDNGNYCVAPALGMLLQPPEQIDVALFRGYRVPLVPLNYDPDERGFAALNGCDLVILAGLDPVALTPQEHLALVAFVERGGGLLLIGGTHSFGNAEGTYFPLAVMLPVEIQRGLDVEVNALPHPAEHPIARGLPEPLGYIGKLHPVEPKPGTHVALTVNERPLAVAGDFGYGRVVVLATYPECEESEYGWFFTGDAFDDFMRNTVAWLTKAPRTAWIDAFALPVREVTTGSDHFGKVLLRSAKPVDARLVTRLTREGEVVHEDSSRCHIATAREAIFSFTVPSDPMADGLHYVSASLCDLEGRELDRSEVGLVVVNPTRVSLELEYGRRCLVPGETARLRVHAFSERRVPPLQVSVQPSLVDPAGEAVVELEKRTLSWAGSGYEDADYELTVPRLCPGSYRLRVELRFGGGLADAAEEDIHILPASGVGERFPLIAEGGYHLDRGSVEQGIEALVQAGVNTLSLPGPSTSAWGERRHWEAMLSCAEERALRAGMALAHHRHSLVPGLTATAPLDPCPLTGAFRDALDEQSRPILAAAARTPRLLAHEIVPNAMVRWEQLCRCEACLGAYGRNFEGELPDGDVAALDAPAHHGLCAFVSSYWWHVYSALRTLRGEAAPGVRLSLPFGAASFLRAERREPYGDLFSWMRAADLIEVAAEPDASVYGLSLSGHRALCDAEGTQLGALIDLADGGLPPAEAAFTALAHGVGQLRVAENPRFLSARRQAPIGQALGRVFGRIAKAGALLAQSRRPPARLALLFPFTQAIDAGSAGLLEAYQLLAAAFGEVDFVHQRLARDNRIERYDAIAIVGTRCLPKKAAQQIVQFVERGGLVLADRGDLLDEKGRPLPWPEGFFGSAETPVFEAVTQRRRAFGAGRTILYSPDVAVTWRRTLDRDDVLGARALAGAVADALAGRGIRPRLRADCSGVEVGLRSCDGTHLVIAANHGDERQNVRVDVDPKVASVACAFDLLTGEPVPAEGQTLALTLPPHDGAICVLYPERPFSLRLELAEPTVRAGDTLRYKALVVNGSGRPIQASHVLRVLVADPTGRERPDLGGDRVTSGGVLVAEEPLAINELPGEWALSVTDLLTRRIVRRTFTLIERTTPEAPSGEGSATSDI